MDNKRIAWVLINVGTPDKPRVREVRRYLTEFLNDPRVIDIPWLARKLIVNGVIIPFRAPKSTKLYRRLWTSEGSPLLVNMEKAVEKLQEIAGNGIEVTGMMRYGRPSLTRWLRQLSDGIYSSIVFLPLYPQYSEATTGSVIQLISREMRRQHLKIPYQIIENFYEHPDYIDALTRHIILFEPGQTDHILFSFHGLPLRQVEKVHPGHRAPGCDCAIEMPADGRDCYLAQCHFTVRLLAERLGLDKDFYTVSFQSRLSKKWTTPFTDKTLMELARAGKKKILVVPASFVADCLETLIEIGEEDRKKFMEQGGEELIVAESLNDRSYWIAAIFRMMSGAGG